MVGRFGCPPKLVIALRRWISLLRMAWLLRLREHLTATTLIKGDALFPTATMSEGMSKTLNSPTAELFVTPSSRSIGHTSGASGR